MQQIAKKVTDFDIWLAPNIRQAIEYYKYSHASECADDTAREIRRNLARGDLFYLLVYVLNRRDIVHPWLFDRCREYQANPYGYLDLWARDHYKSTIITFGHSIQEIIDYTLRDALITIGIFSHTRPIAKQFLKQIKQECTNNQKLYKLFPEVFWQYPEKEAPMWSDDEGLVFKRKQNPKEATVEAWGLVEGQPTSKHFTHRKYDDVVTRESVTTPEQIKKTLEAWELSDSLGTDGGVVSMAGTRYHLHDPYHTMMERGAIKPRIHPATHNGRMDGKPVFLTQSTWDEKLKNISRKTIAAQQLLNPLADEDATFRIGWLRSYEVRPKILNVYIMCDPSKGRNAQSDNTAIAVIGVSMTGNRYLLDGYCHRMTLSQRWTSLRDLYVKWSKEPGVQSVKVGYERYGAQSDDEYFTERMEAESRNKKQEDKVFFQIKELNWTFEGTKGEQGKTTRVERLEPDFRNGRFYLPMTVLKNSTPMVWHIDDDPDSKTYQSIIWQEIKGPTKKQREALEGGSMELLARAIKRLDEEKHVYDVTVKFIEEYQFFPFGAYKDLIDATSRLYDMEPLAPQIVSKAATEDRVYFDS